MSKKALGKGIGALISATKLDDETQSTTSVAIDLIKPNPQQPRKIFSEESLKELAASIKEKGIIQPVLVDRNPDQSFTLIAGERRFRAAKLAGLTSIPVLVKSFSETEKIEIALIENIQREDLTPIEEATAYDALIKLSDLNQEALAAHLGKNRSTVANSLRLLKLPAKIKEALNERTITAGHARAILSAGSQPEQLTLFESIVSRGLSVREAEALAIKMNKGEKAQKKGTEKQAQPRVPEIEEIKQKLMDILGTKVEIKGSLKQGKIEISYFSEEDLERLYELLIGPE